MSVLMQLSDRLETVTLWLEAQLCVSKTLNTDRRLFFLTSILPFPYFCFGTFVFVLQFPYFSVFHLPPGMAK